MHYLKYGINQLANDHEFSNRYFQLKKFVNHCAMATKPNNLATTVYIYIDFIKHFFT